MSIAMWKLEKDLCRCCHAEGSFKNLSEPCFQLGQEEVYLDMLQECLDIKIIPITGELSDVTYTICESCIARLRDASNFKRQVMDCEERFKDMYSRNLIRGIGVKEEPIILSDSEDMKQELQSMDDDDDDDDAFLKFDDDTEGSELTVSDAPKPKSKSKPKTKTKEKQPAKKQGPKKVKEEPPVTEAAVSGEKKKGVLLESRAVCTVSRKDDTEVFACVDCGREYFTRGNFLQHYRHIHLKLRPKTYPCPVCKIPLLPHRRAEHMEAEHNRPAPACNICGKKFSASHFVLRHQRVVHMGERNFKCDLCDLAFPDRRYLKRHYAKHSDVRNYECHVCGKRFKWKKNADTHMDMHLDIRRHVCAVCGDSFVQSSSLKYHMRKRHPSDF